MTAPAVPTFVIEYPEAVASAEFLMSTRGIDIDGTFAPYGRLPDAKSPARELPAGPFIAINGSGNYHHETTWLYEGFLAANPDEQFCFVQIDAHPDKDDTFRWKIDCYNFVGRIMENDRTHRVVLLGMNPENLDFVERGRVLIENAYYYRCEYFEKLHQWVVPPRRDIVETFWKVMPHTVDVARGNISVDTVTEVRLAPPGDAKKPEVLRDGPRPALEVTWKDVAGFSPTMLPDLDVYLTIDLDVAKDAIVTDWRFKPTDDDWMPWGLGDNQGRMPYDDMLALIRRIGRHRRIRGADFCGMTEGLDQLPDGAYESSLIATLDVYDALCDAIASAGAEGSLTP